jgi:hypothetical protein
MGTFNPNPQASQNASKSEPLISKLVNSVYYFIEDAFVVQDGGDYRLIVCHHGQVLADQLYTSLRGAKIAFSKLFQTKAYVFDAKPEWSHLYPPEKDWLDEKLKICVEHFGAQPTSSNFLAMDLQ